MVVVVKNGIDKAQQEHLVEWLKSMNIDVHATVGEYQTILGLIGDTSHVDIDLINSLDIVEMLMTLEDELDIIIPDDATGIKTVKDIATFIENEIK